MKATRIIDQTFRSLASVEARPIGLGLLAVVVFAQLGCATRDSTALTHAGSPPIAAMIRLEPGPIGLLPADGPAKCSFEKSSGRTAYASDGAVEAARAVLDPPELGDPRPEAAVSVVGFAIAPVAAAIGAIHAAHSKMPAEKLQACETNLLREMARAADQTYLRKCFLESAAERNRRNIVPIESTLGASSNREPVSAVIQVTVEELRLERTGRSDTSFALLMKTRVRLVRTSDGTVLYNQPFVYRSGQALFMDWTLDDALKDVAETGYRRLADQMVEEIVTAPKDSPLLVGAGYGEPGRASSSISSRLASHRTELNSPPRARFVSYSNFGPGVLGVYSTETDSRFVVQRPLTKDEAVSEAVHDVEWSLDGLQDSGNLVVQLSAYAVAVPMSLWKQSVAGVQGLTEKQFREADAQLTAAVRQVKPPRELANQVAQLLTSNSSQPVVVINELPRFNGPTNLGLIPVTARNVPETILEIHVTKAGLTGKGGANPFLSVSIDARAILLRASDGQEIYSCPVRYRSAAHKFTEWARSDAQGFRLETDKSYRELARALVEQLQSQGLISPGMDPQTTFAQNSQ